MGVRRWEMERRRGGGGGYMYEEGREGGVVWEREAERGSVE